MSRKNNKHNRRMASKGSKSRKSKAVSHDPGLSAQMETLEPRLLLSTLDVVGGALTYTATAGIINVVDMSTPGANYLIGDTGEAITLGAGALLAGWTNPTANTAQGTTASVTASLTFNLDDLADVINVRGNAAVGGTTIVNAGGDIDLILVGDSGTLDNILSTVTINGDAGGTDALAIDDSADTDANTYLVTSTAVTRTGSPAITYATIEALQVDGGTGGSIFNIRSTLATTPTAVNTGSGADTINVSSDAPTNTGNLNGIAGVLTIDAQAGSNTLVVVDASDASGNTNAIITSTDIQNMAGAADNVTISYAATAGTFGGGVTITASDDAVTGDTVTVQSTSSGPTTVNTGAGPDTVNVRANTGTLAVNTGAANDTINVSSDAPTNTGNLDGIASTLTIDAGAGTNILFVVDASDASGNTNAIITSTNIQNMAGAADNVTINYAATTGTFGGGITITASDDAVTGDTVTVQSTSASPTTINTGAGADTANIQANTGLLAVNTQADNDTINVSSNAPTNTGNLDGIASAVTIDAGAGSNTLVVADPSDASANTNAIITGTTIQNMAGPSDNVTINYAATAGTFGGGVTITASDDAVTGDTVTVQGTSSGPTTVNTGAGPDTANIQANTGTLAVNTQAGDDVINVSSNAPTNTGNLDGIASALTIDAGAGSNTLVVADPSDASANTNAIVTSTDIQNMAGAADNVTINYAATAGTFGGGITITASDDAVTGDTVTVQSTNASATEINTGAGPDTVNVRATTGTLDVHAGAGIDTINVSSDAPANTGNLSGLVGTLTVDSGTAAGSDVLNISESGYGSSDTVNIDLDDVGATGYGTIQSSGDVWLVQVDRAGGANNFGGGVNVSTGNSGNTIYVVSTYLGEALRVNSGDGADTINISNPASAVTGSLDDINAAVTINSMLGADTLNVVDNTDTTADTASITDSGGNITTLAGFAPASIMYYDDAAAQDGLEILNVLAGQGGNAITVNDTTASTSTYLNSGIGDDTLAIDGDKLSAVNTFTGNTGSDTITLSVTADLGATSLFPLTSLTFNGNDPVPPIGATVRDKLTINDAVAATARDFVFTYEGSGGVDITAGIGGGFAIPVEVDTIETVIYNGDPSDNDTVTVYGTAHNDILTAAPIDASRALVFFNGDPFFNNTGQVFGTSLPGISGITDPTLAGPDLLLTGLDNDVLTGIGLHLNGGGADGTGTYAEGDRIVVYANSEADLVDAASTEDFFGFGAGVLIDGLGSGNAYDTISVTDSRVVVVNAGVGTIIPVYMTNYAPIDTADRVTFTSLHVNAGQEAMPTDTATMDVADNITVTLSATIGIQINGNNPAADPLREYDGDRLNVIAPAEINIWSDLLTPPNVVFNSTIAGSETGGLMYSSIESILLTPGNGIVNVLGDNNTSTTQEDVYTVVGTNLNALGFGTTDYGVGEFVLSINDSSNIAFTDVLFLNISGDMYPGDDFTTPSTSTADNTLNIQAYADNTPTEWGIDVRFRGGSSVISDYINYTGVDGVVDAITVAPSGVGTGQIIVPNVVTIDYVFTEDLTITGNTGLAGDTDTLSVNGVIGDDTITMALTAAGTDVDPYVTVTIGASTAIRIDSFTNFDAISAYSLDGDDTLVVDSSAGTSAVLINYDGGVGYDALSLTGGTATSDNYWVGADNGSGTSQIVIGGVTQTVEFQNIEPIVDVVAGPLAVNATDADNAITYTQGTLGSTYGLITVDGYESIEFINKTTLAINAGAGSDHVSLDNDSATGPTGLTTITVDAGPAGENDQLFVTALAGLAPADVDLTGVGAATISDAQANDVSETGFAGITVDAPTGLIVTTNGAGNTVTYEAGILAGTGTVQVDELTPVYFTGGPSDIEIADGGALVSDILVVQGDENDNTFSVTGGVVTADGQAITTTSISDVVLDGLDGNDTFTISGAQTYDSITLHGGDSSGLDVAGVTGTGAAMAIGMSETSGSVSGGGVGAVALYGIERLEAANGAGDVTINSGLPDDNYELTINPDDATVEVAMDGSTMLSVVSTTGTLIIDPDSGANSVTVNGTPADDAFAIVRNAVQTTITGVGATTIGIDSTDTSALVVGGGMGNDTFAVSGAAGPEVTIYGGAGEDALSITNTAAGLTTVAGFDDDSGEVSNADGDVDYNDMDMVSIIAAAGSTLTVYGTDGNDAITQFNNGVGVNNQAPVYFSTFEGLTLSGLAGDDVFDVYQATLPAAILTMTVDGGGYLNGDSILLNASISTDTINFTPTTINSGSVAITGFATVDFSAVQTVTIDGLGGNDELTVTATAGDDSIAYTPTAFDAGNVVVNGLVPLTFQNTGAGGLVTIDGNGGEDTLTYNGTNSEDFFIVGAGGTVELSDGFDSYVDVAQTDITNLAIEGNEGDDRFTVTGPQTYTQIILSGGDPSGSDMVAFEGTGVATSVGMSGFGSITGGGLTGTIFTPGIESLYVDNVAGAITISGTGGNDEFDVWASDLGVAHFELEGFVPTVDAETTGTLTLDTAGGVAGVDVFGSADDDVIDVVMGATTTVGVTGFFDLSLTATTTSSLEVNGWEGDDLINVSGTGGPSLFVDGHEGFNLLTVTTTTAGTTTVAGNDSLVETPDFDVSYTAINGIGITGVADSTLEVLGTNAGDTISQVANTVAVNAQAPVTFSTFDVLSIQTLQGDDTTTLDGSATGLTSLVVDSNYGELVVMQDTGLATPTTVNVTGNNAATITNAQAQPITASGIHEIVMVMAENSLTVQTPVGATDVTYGIDAVGADDIDVGGLMDLDVAGVTVPVSIANTGGLTVDTLIVNGDTYDNAFTLAGNVATIDGRTINTPGVGDVELNGLAGDDSFVVSGTDVYDSVVISGGEPSASDMAAFVGDGTAVTANMGGSDVEIAGGGLGDVTLVGVEAVGIDNVAGAITISGTGGNDEFDVWASDLGVAHFELEGFVPTVDAETTGTLTLDTAGGVAGVDVFGSADDDVIDVVMGATTTVGVTGFFDLSLTATTTSSLEVNGWEGDDLINVSGTGGPSLFVDGHEGFNLLTVTTTTAGTTTVAGNDSLVETPDFDVSYTAINGIGITGVADSTLEVLGTNAGDTISQVANTVAVNAQAPVTFSTFDVLSIQTLQGDDTTTLDGSATGLTSLVVDSNYGELVVMQDTGLATPTTVNVTGNNAATITNAQAQPITASGIHEIVMVMAENSLTVQTPVGATDVTYGIDAVGADDIDVGGLMDLDVAGVTVPVSIANTGGLTVDTLIVNGDTYDNAFTLAGNVATIDGRTINTPGVGDVELNGLAGDDSFVVSGTDVYDSVVISGGEPSASDMAAFVGDGTAVTANMGGSDVEIAGGGLGDVTLVGVELVTLDNGVGSITVNGTADNDEFTVTSVATDMAGITLTGFNTVVDATTTGTLTVDALGGTNQLNVDGTAADDLIVMDGSTVTINGVDIDYADFASVAVSSLAGNDDVTVTVSDVSVFVDGGEPTGSTPSDHLTVNVLGAPTSFEQGPENDAGVVKATGYEYVSFDEIEGLTISGASPAIINGTNGDDMITVIARDSSTHVGADGVQDFTSTVNDGLEVLWLNAASATVNALSGNDDIDIVATAPNDADWNVAVTVNGGYGQDHTSVKTLDDHDVIYTPADGDTGLLTIDDTAPSTVQMNDMDEFFYGAQGADGTLSVVATTDDNVIHYTALTEDSGLVQVDNQLAMEFNGMGDASTFTIEGLAGTDSLFYMGTDADDTFDVAATTGAISLSADGADYVTVEQTGVEELTIRGLEGDDDFTINSSTGYDVVKLDGGLPSASDSVLFNGTAGADNISIDVGAKTISSAGDLVLLTSVEHVGANAGGGNDTVTVSKVYNSADGGIVDVNVELGAGNDAITVNDLAGSSTGTVGVELGDGDDDVTINGTNDNDSINAEVVSGRIAVSGLSETVVIAGSDPEDDLLTINGSSGDDSIVANDGVEDLIDVTINGDAGADYIFGNGLLNGGAGDDRIEIGLGASVVNGGTGINTVISCGNVNFTLTNTSLVGSGTATLTNIQQAELNGGTSNNTFDIGLFSGKVTIAGYGGSDTLDFGDSLTGVNLDLDRLNVFQNANGGGLQVQLTDVIANVIGSVYNDRFWVDCMTIARSIDGNDASVVPLGDILFVDAQNLMAQVSHMVGGVPDPDAGTVEVVNCGTITFDEIQTLLMLNNAAATGFSGGTADMPAYTSAVNYVPGGSKVRAITVGDLNGDGYQDLVATMTAGPRIVSALLNNGYGVFSTPTTYAVSGVKKMCDVHLADVDGDGDLDMVTAGSYRSRVTAVVLLNNGDGTFATPVYSQTDVRTKNALVACDVGDIDDDGDVEIIVGNSRQLIVMDNAGSGAFTETDVLLTGGRSLRKIEMVDTDGDAVMDLMAVASSASRNVSIFRNPDADGDWVLSSIVGIGRRPTSLAMADYNNDGLYEIALSDASSNVLTVLASTAYGNWYMQSEPQFSTLRSARAQSIVAGDVNGDGNMDILISGATTRSVTAILSNGNGTFSDPQSFTSGTVRRWQPTAVAVGDFNSDGGLDVVAANGLANNISVLLKNPV